MGYKPIKYPEESRTYHKEKAILALIYCPPINPCPRCGHPVVRGYACMTCNYGSIEKGLANNPATSC